MPDMPDLCRYAQQADPAGSVGIQDETGQRRGFALRAV